MRRRVRDAGVAGSNPATPTRLLTNSTRYRDSYRDRNGSATVFARDDRQSETRPPIALGPFQEILFHIKPADRRGLFVARVAAGSGTFPSRQFGHDVWANRTRHHNLRVRQ